MFSFARFFVDHSRILNPLKSNQKYPEDITRYLRPVKCTFIYNNIRYEIEFYNKPIDYPKFNLKFSHPEIEKWIEEQTGKERKIKKETSKVYFKISKITVIEIEKK